LVATGRSLGDTGETSYTAHFERIVERNIVFDPAELRRREVSDGT
jgi:hypothetical protein